MASASPRRDNGLTEHTLSAVHEANSSRRLVHAVALSVIVHGIAAGAAIAAWRAPNLPRANAPQLTVSLLQAESVHSHWPVRGTASLKPVPASMTAQSDLERTRPVMAKPSALAVSPAYAARARAHRRAELIKPSRQRARMISRPPSERRHKKVVTARVSPAIKQKVVKSSSPPGVSIERASLPARSASAVQHAGDKSGAASRPARPVAGNSPPHYPRLARRRGLQGRVLLLVEVSAQGEPGVLQVIESSGTKLLDNAARDAVARWRFQPALEGGAAVPAQIRVPVEFRLDAHG